MTTRLSVDIGGTFTDVVLEHNASLTSIKVLTTYDDPARGVIQGIQDVLTRSAIPAAQVSVVMHGTTLATNALIERRGAKTGLLATQGHRDALEMAFENRFEQYDVNIDRPAPLVERAWRIGVEERVAADGQPLLPLAQDSVFAAADELVAQGVESLALGFLHSYVNDAHEREAAELIASRHPQLSLSLSCDVCPEIREYERISTTVANAYVKPLMANYLASLQAQISTLGIEAQILIMTSGGGLTTIEAAANYPIRLVESGPAGGAILAADIAKQHGLDEVLSFDMGGTTAKIALIDHGEPQQSRAFEVDRSYRFKKGSGLPVRIPVIEMVEIGAGGGSIASVDKLQRIQVGPESAGSEPGPASYGRGGTHATVTDADVVLGKLSPQHFAGGKLSLTPELAEQAVQEHVATPLSLSSKQAAYAVSEIVEENMASAARAHAAEWGKDLSQRCLIAFGGAAPLHAAGLARRLKIQRMLIPQGAGVGSAIGFLRSPIRFEVVRSLYSRLQAMPTQRLTEMFEQMHQEAASVLQGANVITKITERREAYMRYVGQGYEVAVPISTMQDFSPTQMRAEFESAYAQLYGRTIPGMEIEILSWTLSLTAAADSGSATAGQTLEEDGASLGTLQSYSDGELKEVALVARSALPTQMSSGEPIQGPLLVVEEQTTSVIPSNAELEVLADGTLSVTWS